MARANRESQLSRCTNCGFEAASRGDDWEWTESPSFGRMTSCPDCGSTDITLRR